MEGYVRVGGAWKSLDGIHVKVSSTWKTVNNGFVKVSGGWKQFYQALNLLGGARGASLDTDPSSVTVGFRFNRDGSVDKKSEGAWGSSGVWMNGSGVPSDVGDNYEIEVSWVSGDTPIQPVLADGLYRTLDSQRSFDKTATPGDFYSASLTFTIREIVDTANNVTGSWTCATEDGS